MSRRGGGGGGGGGRGGGGGGGRGGGGGGGRGGGGGGWPGGGGGGGRGGGGGGGRGGGGGGWPGGGGGGGRGGGGGGGRGGGGGGGRGGGGWPGGGGSGGGGYYWRPNMSRWFRQYPGYFRRRPLYYYSGYPYSYQYYPYLYYNVSYPSDYYYDYTNEFPQPYDGDPQYAYHTPQYPDGVDAVYESEYTIGAPPALGNVNEVEITTSPGMGAQAWNALPRRAAYQSPYAQNPSFLYCEQGRPVASNRALSTARRPVLSIDNAAEFQCA